MSVGPGRACRQQAGHGRARGHEGTSACRPRAPHVSLLGPRSDHRRRAYLRVTRRWTATPLGTGYPFTGHTTIPQQHTRPRSHPDEHHPEREAARAAGTARHREGPRSGRDRAVPGGQAPCAENRGGLRGRCGPRRVRRGEPRGLREARRDRRDGRGRVPARSDLAGCRASADRAPPLRARRRPARRIQAGRGRRARRPHPRRRRRRTRPRSAGREGPQAHRPPRRLRARSSGRAWSSSSTAEDKRRRGGRSRGHRCEAPAGLGTREGDLLRPAGRGDRVGSPHRLPPHGRQPPARPCRAQPQQRTCHGVGQGGRGGPGRGPGTRGVRRHPVRTSAASPRPPPSRSSCSGCGTPRTT